MEAISAIKTSKLQLRHTHARLRKSSFVKNVLVVMSGTAAVQIIDFALSPIMSRLFSPSDFGIFDSFDAVFGVIAAGVTLEYTHATMLPKERKDAINRFFVWCLAEFIQISFDRFGHASEKILGREFNPLDLYNGVKPYREKSCVRTIMNTCFEWLSFSHGAWTS
jgi:hypothetical protein